MKKIDIIIPCYNEEQMIELFYFTASKITNEIENYKFEYIMINDGSSDNTIKLIRDLAKENDNVKYISFSRNFGKEAAILAGLRKSDGDYAVIMDADLQHPPEILKDMIKKLEEGYDSVSTKRVSRNGEGKYRGVFSKAFFKLINKISDTKVIEGATDFRIMSRQMINSILELSEYHRFSKGIFEWVGYDTYWLEYTSEDRVMGEYYVVINKEENINYIPFKVNDSYIGEDSNFSNVKEAEIEYNELYIGKLNYGNILTIPKEYLKGIKLICVKQNYIEEAIESLNKISIKALKKDKNGLSTEVTLKEEGYLYLPILYSKYWDIKVNGEKVEPLKVNGGFIAFELNKGNYNIEMKYNFYIKYIGFAITLATLILLSVISTKSNKISRKEKNL